MDKPKYEMLVWSMQGEAQDASGAFRLKVLTTLLAYILFGLLALLLGSARDSRTAYSPCL